MKMNSGKKKVDKLETSRPEEQGGEFPGFPSCFIYPKLAEEAGKPEMPITKTEKAPTTEKPTDGKAAA